MANRLPAFAIMALLAVVIAVESNCYITAAAEPPIPAATTEPFADWIRLLGHPDFQVREGAARELAKRPDAGAAVRQLTGSADPEVAQRAAAILREYDRLLLVRLMGNMRDSEPDLFVERVMRYSGDPDEIWQAITEFGSAIYHIEGRTGERWIGHRRVLPDRDFTREKILGPITLPADTEAATDRSYYLFRGPTLTVGSRANLRLAVVSGELRSVVLAGMIFVNGGVKIIEGPPRFPGMHKSAGIGGVLVCGGNVEFPLPDQSRQDRISHAVLICQGTVRCPNSITNSVILAAGDVYIPDGATVTNSTIRAGGAIIRPSRFNSHASKLEENVADATKPFRFFELSRVGLEAVAAKDGVRVAKLADKSPLAAAGLKKGDFITAVDGKPADSPATLRKLLRSAVAQGYGTLTVRRGEKSIDLSVRFAE